MKIRIINQAFTPDESATAQYVQDLATQLQKAGDQVEVLTSARGYLNPTARYPGTENLNGIQITRVFTPALGRRIPFLRILDALLMNLAFFLNLFFSSRKDLNIVLTSPPLLAFFVACIPESMRGKFVYWIMDINPEQAARAGWIKKSSLTFKLLLAAQKFAYRRAARLIVLDEAMAHLIESYAIPSQKISVIPLWWDASKVSTVSQATNPFRLQQSLQNKFVVMYSGNHSICHPLGTLLEAARTLSNEPRVQFLFIGGGSRVEEVRHFKEMHALDNIRQIAYQERDSLGYSLAAADLHIVSMGNEYVGIVHPSKAYPVLALGRPIIFIGNSSAPLAKLLATVDNCRVVEHGAVAELSSLIKSWLEIPEEQRLVSTQAQSTAQQFTIEKLCQDLISTLKAA